MERETVERSKEWTSTLLSILNEKHSDAYKLVGTKCLVGIYLGVFIKTSLYSHLSNIEDTLSAFGLMGIMGNKGGVAIRMDLYNTSLCFICSHLAAHTKNLSQRNQNYYQMMNEIKFNTKTKTTNTPYTINDHDIVLWIGDLNYRINPVLSYDTIFKNIRENNIEPLIEKDQLIQSKDSNQCFNDFVEPPINFLPTYKYKPKTNMYNTEGEKKREPAWCDRIQYYVKNKENMNETVRVYEYSRYDNLQSSDHKPVYCIMKWNIKKINQSE